MAAYGYRRRPGVVQIRRGNVVSDELISVAVSQCQPFRFLLHSLEFPRQLEVCIELYNLCWNEEEGVAGAEATDFQTRTTTVRVTVLQKVRPGSTRPPMALFIKNGRITRGRNRVEGAITGGPETRNVVQAILSCCDVIALFQDGVEYPTPGYIMRQVLGDDHLLHLHFPDRDFPRSGTDRAFVEPQFRYRPARTVTEWVVGLERLLRVGNFYQDARVAPDALPWYQEGYWPGIARHHLCFWDDRVFRRRNQPGGTLWRVCKHEHFGENEGINGGVIAIFQHPGPPPDDNNVRILR